MFAYITHCLLLPDDNKPLSKKEYLRECKRDTYFGSFRIVMGFFSPFFLQSQLSSVACFIVIAFLT